jgi:hypothetical protein
VGTPVSVGQLVVTGLLRQRKASVRVLVGHDATDARAFDLEVRSGENAGHLAARGWATAKIDALSLDYASNRDDIRRTSRDFGIVTADTSLLVLETVEDYARFEIPPPPELRAEWERRVRFVNNNRLKERETHLDRVARAWSERVAWWETRFPARGYSFDGKDDSDASVRRGRSAAGRTGAATPAPTRPAPVVGGAIGGAVIGDSRGGGLVFGDAMPDDQDEAEIVMSPFEVSTESGEGYVASATLAGNRMRTELRDIGGSISVITSEEMSDAAATDPGEPLRYTANTEIGGPASSLAGVAEPAGEVAKRREAEGRFRAATGAGEELAVAEGFTAAGRDNVNERDRAAELEDRLRRLQEERQASLNRKSAPESSQGRISAAAQEIAALEAELAALRREPAARPAPRARMVRADTARHPSLAGRMFEPWNGDTGCRDRFRRVDRKEWYAVYLDERADRARQPGFYLDVAEFFLTHDERALGLRVLSNLAELALEDAPLLRVLGHRLTEVGRADLARPVFERVLEIRSEEPQSRRDLALVCAELGEAQRAVDLLWEVVATPWHDRFPEIELIALSELNAIAARSKSKVDLDAVDPRLRRNLFCGLRVIVTWDADNSDIDLWIDDPSGERCVYNHPRTAQGGRMSRDFTQGYGPEEFLLRLPDPGTYRIRLNYYGDRRQTALGPITAQVRVITAFGMQEENEKRYTVRLADARDTIEIGSVVVGRSPKS